MSKSSQKMPVPPIAAKTRLLAGADEAEEVFKRDAKRLTNQARAKAGEIKGKTKQAAKNAQKRTIRGGR